MTSRRGKQCPISGKMTNFFTYTSRSHSQDGAGGRREDTCSRNMQHRTDSGNIRGRNNNTSQAYKIYSPPPSASSSPAKSRQRMSVEHADTEEVSGLNSSLDDTRELQDSITDFPTSNQPVMDTTLKDMLVSLRSTLHSDILAITHQFKSEVKAVSNRVTHIESKMGEFANTFNDMVDAQIKTKLADLEDRSRRNNVKIRGIPKTVKPPDLKNSLVYLMKLALPEAPLEDLVIDRIHRLPKPKNIPAHLPRDTMVRIHFYHIKDQSMAAARRSNAMPQEMQDLSFFADLSAFTMQQHKQLATITKPLNNHHIPYRWLYPAKLMVTKDGESYVIATIKDGLQLLKEWKILEPVNAYGSPPSTRPNSDAESS